MVATSLRDTLLRLLSLLDTPADIPVLGSPMVERELLYRLLQAPKGDYYVRLPSPMVH